MTRAFRFTAAIALLLSAAGCSFFGGDDEKSRELEPRTTALGVNGYLWQATLETLSFLPIDDADPRGGVIISDWHSTADMPDERVRVMVSFRSQQLRSDGIKVTVYRQMRDGNSWKESPVQAQTALQIEEAILTKARQLRVGVN